MQGVGHGQLGARAPGGEVPCLPLTRWEEPLAALLHRPQAWPIWLVYLSSAVDGGVAALAGDERVETHGLAKAIKAVAQMEGAW